MATIIEDSWVNLVEGTDENDDVTINGGANTVDLTQGGNDILRANWWIDTVEMGKGDDDVLFNAGSGANRVDLGNGVNSFNSASDIAGPGGYVSEITAGKGDHFLTVGTAGVGSIEIAKNASSTSTFLGFVSEFIGGNQSDTIFVSGGAHAGDFELRRGDDNISASSAYFNSIDAGRGDDSVVVGGARSVDLGGGHDSFSSSSDVGSVGRVDGGNGQDNIELGAGGNAFGGNAQDTLIGGMGSDKLFGEDGNDTFVTSTVDTGALDVFDGGSRNKDLLIIDVRSEKEKLALEAELADFEPGEVFFISSLNLRIDNIEIIEIRTPDFDEF